MLLKKLWRTMGLYKAQFISMIIMIALGIGVFVGFNMEWKSIEINTARFYEETGFADYRLVKEKGFSTEELDKIAAIDGVEKAGRFVSFNTAVSGTLCSSKASLTTRKTWAESGFPISSLRRAALRSATK